MTFDVLSQWRAWARRERQKARERALILIVERRSDASLATIYRGKTSKALVLQQFALHPQAIYRWMANVPENALLPNAGGASLVEYTFAGGPWPRWPHEHLLGKEER